MPGLRDRRNTDLNELGLNIASSSLRGIDSEFKFGHNTAVGSTFETIWPEGGIYVYPSTASTMTLSSSNTNDYAGGSGVRSVRIFGLDTNYNEITEDITLHATDGLLAVTTINTYLRVHRIYALTAGSNNGQVGKLYMGTGTVTIGVPAVIYGVTAIGHNQTTQTIYTVPAGKTAFITGISASGASGKDAEIHFMAKTPSAVFTTKYAAHIYQSPLNYYFNVPLRVEEKVDLEVRGSVPQTAGSIYTSFEFILVDNDLLP